MPHLTFPLSGDGLAVQAVIGLNGADTAALARARQPIPRPVQVRALIDPGSDVTGVAAHVFGQLGLSPLIAATSQTADGSVPVNLYRASLTVPGPGASAGPTLVLSDLLVSELAAPLPNIDALIGLDVLRDCLLVLNGPGQQFILGF